MHCTVVYGKMVGVPLNILRSVFIFSFIESMCTKFGGLSLPRKSVVRLTDRHDITLDVNRGRKTSTEQQLLLH